MRVAILFALASAFGISEALRRNYKKINGVCYYNVLSRDTIPNIAADFCMDPSRLGYPGGKLPVGQTIKVSCERRNNPRDCAKIPNSQNGYYNIVSGDTLNNIAPDFCTDADALVNLNKGNQHIISKDSITPGIINVPCSFN